MRLAAGLRPDPLGSYSAPSDPLAVMGKGRAGRGREWEKGEGKGRERREGRGEGKGHSNPPQKSLATGLTTN